MAEQREFEGKDLAEAVELAASRLGIPAEELDYEIVEQGRKGVFGLGARSVRIRAIPPLESLPEGEETPRGAASRPTADPAPARGRRRPAASPAPRGPERPPAREIAIPADRLAEIERTVGRMLELLGFSLTVEAKAGRSGVVLSLAGEDQSVLLEKDGEPLAALQFLLNRMSRRAWGDVGRIHLNNDGGGSRDRDEDLIELTREVAQQVSRTGKPKRLHPMNAYERRLVHITVREFGGLVSRSDGDGLLKRVRIARE